MEDEKEKLEYIECTENLCTIILDDAIALIEKSDNRCENHNEIIKLLEKVGSEKRMFLHKYDENGIIFTIFNVKLKKILMVEIQYIAPGIIKVDVFSKIQHDF